MQTDSAVSEQGKRRDGYILDEYIQDGYIPDEYIRADIWDALWREDPLRALDLGSLSLQVKDGRVLLQGHLVQENSRAVIEAIAAATAGVRAVQNDLVVDRDLMIQVLQALLQDARTRSLNLPVGVSHGWIHLGGEVPTRELQLAAEEVAGRLPAARGVIGLPRLSGASPNVPPRPLQPRIGAAVYGGNRQVGVVTQVVIQPSNRLVTHVVIRSHETRGIHRRARENVVPVADFERAKNASLFLGREAPPLNIYPDFDPDAYPLAPFTWKAPYPYSAGEVRWWFQEILAPESRSGASPARESGAQMGEIAAPALASGGA